jgi:prolyl oligopeptidase
VVVEEEEMRRVPYLLILVAFVVSCAPSDGPPPTRQRPMVDTYHGVDVVDDYRWLEDWDDPAVQSWSEAQNAYAREQLASLPHLDDIRRRVQEILEARSDAYYGVVWRPSGVFALRDEPTRQQPALVVMADPDRPQEAMVLVDPVAADASGSTTIDWFVPSPDGSLVAVSMSVGGSESGDVRIIDVASQEVVGGVTPRVNGGTAGGDLAWTRDGAGFYYTRYPRAGERPDDELSFHQQLWYRTLDGSVDRPELADGLSRVSAIRVATDPSSDRVLATVQEGDSGRFEHWLRTADGSWTRLTSHADRIAQAEFAPDGTLFLLSRLEAPRGRILRLAAGAPSLDDAVVVVEESEHSLVHNFYGASPMIATATRLYATSQLGGPSTLRAFDHDGRPVSGPEVPEVSSVGAPRAAGGDAIVFTRTSYATPQQWLMFDPTTNSTHALALSSTSPVDLSSVEASRVMVTSADGTQVPLNILHPEGTELDGSNPTLLTGYGGFGISRVPRFSALRAVWLENGGVFADANLRGGGEFGEQWHHDGRLTAKQNVFDDFAAAMRYLVDVGYTSPGRLAIEGGSNGGLLMGAMITQHPQSFRVAVSHVGIYDMLRVELSSNGAFNIPEYGTVADEEQFRALYAYSPYHRVVDGEAYPSVLFLTGANDPRVDPMQSRKMTARLQAATSSDRPVLLRTSADTGHGGAPLDEVIDASSAVYAFLFHELGVEPQYE